MMMMMMKQSSKIVAMTLTLLIASSSLVAPTHGRKRHSLASSPASAPASSPASAPASSPAPSPASLDCSTVIFDMADCLSFISDGSKDAMPSKSCCDGMNSVLGFNPACICAGLDIGRQMGIMINNTRAVSMPSLCKTTIVPPACGFPSAGPSPHVSPMGPTPSSLPPAEAPGNSAEAPGNSAEAPMMPSPTPATETPETSPPPSSGAGTLSVSVLFLVAMTLSSFA